MTGADFCEADRDGDGKTRLDRDCDDSDPTVYLKAPNEVAGDGVDTNCNGDDDT